MSYITQADCYSVIEAETLAAICDDAQFALAVSQAQSEAFGYLRGRYDIAQIKAQTADQRHEYLVLVLVDLALYHLHSRKTPREVPQIRTDRYTEAKQWLEKTADGTLSQDLPQGEENQQQNGLRCGSNPIFPTQY